MVYIPQEVLDLFLEHLNGRDSPDERKALQVCMRVSKAFFLRARSHLFSSLTLEQHYPQRLNALSHLICFNGVTNRIPKYPSLLSSIKSIKFIFGSHLIWEEVGSSINDVVGTFLSIIASPECELEAFHIICTDLTEYRLIAAYSDIHKSLATICTSSTLKTLIVENIEGFPAEMCNIYRLSTLKTFNTSFQDSRKAPAWGSAEYPRDEEAKLTTLICDFTSLIPSRWINMYSGSSPLQQLRTLHAGFGHSFRCTPENPSTQSQLNRILSLCSSTLENLEIQLLGLALFPSTSSAVEPINHGSRFSLNSLTALRQLSFIVFANATTTARGVGNTWSFDRAVEVTRALKTFGKASPSLQSIVIVLTVELSFEEQFIGFNGPSDGKDLVCTLASSRFAGVEHIEVVFLTIYGRWLGSNVPSSFPFLDNFISMAKGEEPRICVSMRLESFTNASEKRIPAHRILY